MGRTTPRSIPLVASSCEEPFSETLPRIRDRPAIVPFRGLVYMWENPQDVRLVLLDVIGISPHMLERHLVASSNRSLDAFAFPLVGAVMISKSNAAKNSLA